MRILIADDEPRVRFALRVTLERLPDGKTINEAIDTADLFSQALVIPPDLLLLDWELEGIAGEETLRSLRRFCPRLFIIALSGKDEARQPALQAGADAFVSKADPPDLLLAAIGGYWNRAQPRPVNNSESPMIKL